MNDNPKTQPVKAEFTDIRMIIGAALGLIGIFLLVVAILATGPEQLAKTGGINGNLWSGVGLLVISAAMIVWWKLSPSAGSSPSGR